MRWTEEQDQAIYRTDPQILVSAAAGSGKTAVLSERILRFLREGGEISQIMVVTFTNAAAEEMKGRIRRKIKAEQQENLQSQVDWQRQIDQLEWASIQTFHSFCKKVIDQNLYLLPFDKGYSLIQQQERIRIRNEEIRLVLEQYYASETGSLQSVFAQFRTPKSDRKLIEIIDRLQSFLARHPRQEKIVAAKAVWEELLRTEMLIALDSLVHVHDECIEICMQPNGPAKYKAAIEDDRGLAKEVRMLVKDRAYAQIQQSLPLKFKRFQAIKKAEKEELDEVLIDMVKKTRAMAKNLLKKWMEEYLIPLAEWEPNPAMADQVESLVFLARKFDESLQNRKIREGVMDFDDLETYAYQLLQNPAVADRYRKRYSQIFVDEYQDTSYMQEAVLQCIRSGNHLFFVGDGKQSIYQFRGATPRLFLSKAEDSDGGFSCIRLNHNFRSSQTVIDGINAFFNQRMTREFGGVSYHETDQLQAGAIRQGAEKPLFVVLKNQEGLVAEVEWVADEIERMLKHGHQPQSIAVLARSLQPIQEALRAAFQERGIPFQTSQQFDSKDAIVIQMFQALLHYMNGSISDEALLAVMRFPRWNFSPNELSRIRIAYPKGRFEHACRSYVTENHDEIAVRLARFFLEMEEMRERACQIPLGDFLEEILERNDFADSILAMPDGLQKSYGLRAYVADLQSRIERGSMTLHRLCTLIQEERRQGISTSIPSVQGDQGIRLMTVHGSKGLEFDTVFLMNAGQTANLFDLNQSVLSHEDFGLAMTVFDERHGAIGIPLERSIAQLVLRRERVSEELRIFYVGMTRAVERLVVVAHDQDPERTRRKSQYLGTITGGLDFPTLYHWMVGAELYNNRYWEYSEVHYSKVDTGTFLEDLCKWKLTEDAGDARESIEEYLKTPSKRRKVNITEWLRRKENSKMIFEENTDAMDRGNAFHEVLEKIPLKSYHDLSAVVHAVSELAMNRRITRKTVQLVEPELLLKWHHSPIGKRIASAELVLREKAFVGRLPGDADALYAQGKIDCLFREGGKWVLIDYKTRFPKKPEQALRQVRAYCRILSECFHMNVEEAVLYEWETGQTLEVDLD